MEKLPEELLGIIFGILPVPDVLHGVRLVSRKFSRIASDVLSDRVLYSIREPYRSTQTISSSTDAFLRSTSFYKHLYIGMDYAAFLDEATSIRVTGRICRATSLIFAGDTIPADTFVDVVTDVAAKLESLVLRGCDDAMSALSDALAEGELTFPKLQYFGAEWLTSITDQSLARVLLAAPKLRSLSLQGCRPVVVVARDLGDVSVFDSLQVKEVPDTSEQLDTLHLTNEMLGKIIKKFSPGITSLNVSQTGIDTGFVNGLCDSKKPALNLEHLDVESCDELQTGDVVKFVLTFERLKSFKGRILSWDIALDDPLKAVSSQRLRDFRMNFCNDWVRRGLKLTTVRSVLERNPRLETICFPELECDGSLFDGLRLSHLKSLELTSTGMSVKEWISTLSNLASNCKQLEILNLSRNRCINWDVLQTLFSGFSKLKVLRLWYCTAVSDVGLMGFRCTTSGCDGRFETCTHKTGNVFSEMNLKRLEDLIVLDLSYCPHIGDRMLEHALDHPSLEFLDISNTQVTDSGLRALNETARNLVELRVDRCSRLSFEGVVDYVNSAQRLRRISSFDGFHPITNVSTILAFPSQLDHQRKLLVDASITIKGAGP